MTAASSFLGVGLPTPLYGAGRDPAVLALHGFGGTPQEVALVTEVARKYRLRFAAPLLPGHGTNVDDLARSTYGDWHACAVAELEALTERGPAIVVGLSMGAVLALHLAAQLPKKVLAVGVLSNALALTSPFPALAIAAAERLHLPNVNLPKSAPDIADPLERRRHLTYNAQPSAAAAELWRAGARVRTMLPRVECPLLILHGREDRVCPVKNAYVVAKEAASQDKRIVILTRSHHIITRDVERPIVYGELCRFVERIVPSPALGLARSAV